ncbi:MAG: class I SAM-dependent methyltransferase [Promethearchaeota archaeon]
MFGFNDAFIYFQCSKCGCLQIEKEPLNINKYYPNTYYSYHFNPSNITKSRIRWLIKKGLYYSFWLNFGPFSKILSPIYNLVPDEYFKILSKLRLTLNTRILDVGCGAGSLLYKLREIGYKNLLGIDPYIDEDIEYDNGLCIKKIDISKVQEKWDLIMFHHSLEHIYDQHLTFKCIYKLLSNNGICIIRIPIVSSFAWNYYKSNWVQLDPPRHFYLHSIDSIKFIAQKYRLNIFKIIYDSRDFQFWGSEQYIQNIPLRSEKSYSVNKKNSIFTDLKIKKFKKLALILNKQGMGDQAIFYLRKAEL